MDKTSIIYYTNNVVGEPLFSLVQNKIAESGLKIYSSSQEFITFGSCVVTNEKSGYITLVKQILSCLRRATSKYVFFCEHDVLYHNSHFDFVPPTDDLFYYNTNIWRWWLGSGKAIRHDRMLSLSNLCCNRELALEHYNKRLELITERGWEDTKGEPGWVRRMGYEPGTKKPKRGGFFEDDYKTWESEFPNIDVRHRSTFSSPKTKLSEFKHKPKWWEETPIEQIPGWNLSRLLDL